MTTPFELIPNYTVRELPRQEFADLFNARHEELFAGSIRFDVEAAYTEAERQAIRQLNMAMREIYVLRWGIEHDGKLIGWTMGQQTVGATVPKLKAGFYITGMRMTDKFGVMVELSYYINELRRQALNFRSGQQQLTDQLRPLINL